MNKELKQKFQTLIENNFSKMEAKVLSRLVSEHEEVKEKSDSQKNEIKNLESEIEKQVKKINGLNSENEKLKKDHDEMKEKYVTLKLEAAEKSLEQIFKLTEIAFRNPAKLKTFDLPIKKDLFTTQCDSGKNVYSKCGEAIFHHRIEEKTEEV